MTTWLVSCGKTLCGLMHTVWVDVYPLIPSLPRERPLQREPGCTFFVIMLGSFLPEFPFLFQLPLIGPKDIQSRASGQGNAEELVTQL